MAYQVISQNNTTTTLADENGNIIHVPARVSLATSTDYTIKKVNNTTATLEDGNGNIIRDVPCVAVLVGGEGGGGTVDYSKTVQKTNTMPTADATNAGQVFMYTGATDSNYTQNYIYKNVKTATYTGTVSFEAATLSGATVACSGDNFANFLTESGVEPLSVVSGTMTFDSASELWALVGKDSDGNTVLTFQEYQQDFVDAGFTFTGTPQDGDVVAFTCTVEEASASYAWNRIDVQPSPVIPDPLPSQTGNAGKFLTTDGTDASWGNALANNATQSDSVAILGSSTTWGSVAVGGSTRSGVRSIAIGRNAEAGIIGGNNMDAIAIGYNAQATGGSSNHSIAIGSGATASHSHSIAIDGVATAQNSIQLGDGTNSTTNTMQVWNYPLLNKSTGTIPTARLTKVNTTITLAAADWNSNTQTISVTGMTSDGIVMVSPAPTDQSLYTAAGVLCTAQAAGTLTFTCTSVPSADIDVNVVML